MTKIVLLRWMIVCLLGCMALVLPSRVYAQACRRTCVADEIRNADGCCIARPVVHTPTTPRPRPVVPRCPEGTTWSEEQRTCLGQLTCPVGSHPDNGRCVADDVGCPSNAHLENGRCVADAIACPENTTLRDGRCYSEVQCPAGTTLQSGRCISADVQCPAGTHAQASGGCVGDPTCPAGTRFVEGRGCEGAIVCPQGAHSENGRCVPDHVCDDGSEWENGRGCVSICQRYPHSHWISSERRCLCDENYRPQSGQCLPIQNQTCEAGTHLQNGQCVPNVICPYGFVYVPGRGCFDPQAERDEIAANSPEAQQQRLARRWTAGPSGQLWAAGGVAWIEVLQSFQAPNMTDPSMPLRAPARWRSGMLSVGATYSVHEVVVGLTYSRIWNGDQEALMGWQVNPRPLDILLAEIGGQGNGERHTFRIMFQAGTDLAFNYLVTGLAYRSMFRIVAGFYAGFDIRFLGMFRVQGFAGDYCYANSGDCGMNSATVVNNAGGLGGTGQIFLGYSIY